MPVRYGLIEPTDVSLPDIPPATDRLRIAHLSDLHVTRRCPQRLRRRLERLGNQLTTLRLDLVLLTGDYMTAPGDEAAAADRLRRLCAKLRPSLGVYGVFGNHDTAELRERVGDLPVHWLHNQWARVPDHPIEILGLGMLRGEAPDSVALLLDRHARRADPRGPVAPAPSRPLRLMLAHTPSCITTAADMGADVMFSGHTHGGQVRLPRLIPGGAAAAGRALVNACDLPLRMSAGLLRHRDTLAAISRGLGEVGFPARRLFCRPHAPVYTLHRRTMPGQASPAIQVIEAW